MTEDFIIHHTCFFCKHYDHSRFSLSSTRHFCRAFPQAIPLEIATGQVEHTTPYPGDHGIQFELAEYHGEGPPDWNDRQAVREFLKRHGIS